MSPAPFRLLLAIFLLHLSACPGKRGQSSELTDRGSAEFAQKHYEAALDDFRRALALDPENDRARYSIGLVYKEQSKWPEAARAFAEAQQRRPDDESIRRERAFAEAAQKKLDDENAASERTRAAEQAPSPPERVAEEVERAAAALGSVPGVRVGAAGDVVVGAPQVRGRLDGEIVRRIVRRHVNEARFCLEQARAASDRVFGRVVVQFTIAGSGEVVAAVVQNSTLNNEGLEQCIARSVRRWEFPKPAGGGIAIVSQPFVLLSR